MVTTSQTFTCELALEVRFMAGRSFCMTLITMLRRQHVLVDSKWRRLSAYPNSWTYAITFPECFRNVVSLDLIKAIVPNTQQTVHAFNSKFQFNVVGGAVQTIDIPPGNYEPPLLLTVIQQGLEAAGLPNPVVALSPDSNIVTISCDSQLSFPFASGDQASSSIHPYLGFSNLDIDSVNTVSSPFAMSLPPTPYVTVEVDEVPRSAKKRAYSLQYEVPILYNTRPELLELPCDGIVFLDTDAETYKFWQAASTEIIQQKFQPLDMRQFTITLRDDKGKLYDSNMYNHTLVFEILQQVPPDLPLMCDGNNRIPGPPRWGIPCHLPFR